MTSEKSELSLGNSLKQYRKKQQKTVKDVANHLGVSIYKVSRCEKDEVLISLDKARALSQFLKIDPLYLTTRIVQKFVENEKVDDLVIVHFIR